MRHGVHSSGRHWSNAHHRWLADLDFEHSAQDLMPEKLVQRDERTGVLGEPDKLAARPLREQLTLIRLFEKLHGLGYSLHPVLQQLRLAFVRR